MFVVAVTDIHGKGIPVLVRLDNLQTSEAIISSMMHFRLLEKTYNVPTNSQKLNTPVKVKYIVIDCAHNLLISACLLYSNLDVANYITFRFFHSNL